MKNKPVNHPYPIGLLNQRGKTKPIDPFNFTFEQEYELAKEAGDKRFGSVCKHEKTKNGVCVNCLRKVK